MKVAAIKTRIVNAELRNWVFVRVMKKQSFWRLCAIGMSAVSGIEMALWDILGKHLGVPVWRLLGDKVAVYETTDADPLVLGAQALLEKGYRAFKAVFIRYIAIPSPSRCCTLGTPCWPGTVVDW